MQSEADLLAAIAADPRDDLVWVALADCLEENGEDDRAELVRLREWLRHAGRDDPLRAERELRLGELLIAGVKPSVPLKPFALEGKTTLVLALIPPGLFWMGHEDATPSPSSEALAIHRVRLTKPFWIGINSITNAQWLAIQSPQSAAGPKPQHPAQNVLFPDAKEYCKGLTRELEASFRLPTEAEWEYACRAGTIGAVYLGDKRRDKAAWHSDNSKGHTHAVRKKLPNAWGLYDMLGNIWDWCSDAPRRFEQSEEPMVDPVGPSKGNRRVVKGGAWRSSPTRCHAGTRYAEEIRRETEDQGFRVVMDWE